MASYYRRSANNSIKPVCPDGHTSSESGITAVATMEKSVVATQILRCRKRLFLFQNCKTIKSAIFRKNR